MGLELICTNNDLEEIIYGRYIVEISILKEQWFRLLCFSFKNKVYSSLWYFKIKILDSWDINFLDWNLGNKDTFLEFVNQYLLERYQNNLWLTKLNIFISKIKGQVESNF